jgi:hypothetical protein
MPVGRNERDVLVALLQPTSCQVNLGMFFALTLTITFVIVRGEYPGALSPFQDPWYTVVQYR